MSPRRALAEAVANLGARFALRYPLAERLLRAGLRRPPLQRHLKLGAIALGYPRVLQRRALRIAQLDGYKLWVNVAEPLGIEPYFFGRPGTAWMTASLLRPGDVCLDVGANAGHYTFMCAHAVGESGRVISIEPNPEFASLLRESIVHGYQASQVMQLACRTPVGGGRATSRRVEQHRHLVAGRARVVPSGSHVIEARQRPDAFLKLRRN